ncbi:MAG: hypothetical protein HYU24_09275 [Candidatus Rokubacteria bacterium]|nr:hypothetical protein [Candidatus Rokubacteria bacterium]
MNRWWIPTVINRRGVALPLALFALVMLSGLLLAFLTMSGMEPTIAANLSDITRARYIGDAAVEWAYDRLAAAPLTGSGSWNDILAKGGTMATNQAIPGVLGTFTVTMRNDNQPVDNQITGLAACNAQGATDCGPLLPTSTNDNNFVVIVTATGTLNGGTPNQVQRQIQVVVRRIGLPPLPGAVNFPGVQADINPGGTAHLHVNGVDYNRNGSLGTGPLKFGYTVPSGINPATGTTFEAQVENNLTRHDKNEMTGRDQRKPCCVAIARGSDNTCPCEGEYSIVPQSVLPSNEQLTPQKIADFISQVKAQIGGNTIKVNPAKPLVVNSGTSADPSVPVNLGTVSKPTITYIQGTPDPTDRYTSVALNGNTSGAGILILEDADMAISGTFRWDGIILITGKNVGVTFKQGSRAFIYGGLVVDETDKTERAGSYEMLIEANAHGDSSVDQFTTFYSSQQNLNMVQGIGSLVKVTTWREI